jgi:acyl dehydratase
MPVVAFDTPVDKRYFEDYVPGSIHEFGSILVTEKDIVNFALRYDPQVFHINPKAARETTFGGLIASGWHTAAAANRLIIDHYLSHVASLGSPGADELRWFKPVRPDDALSVRVIIIESRRSQSKPDRGIVRSIVEVTNQNQEVVMSWKGVNILRCRQTYPEYIPM